MHHRSATPRVAWPSIGRRALVILCLTGCSPSKDEPPRGEAPAPAPVDEDGDGWPADLDCDDTDPEVHPGIAHDKPYDGVDADCAGDNSDVDGDGFRARVVGGDDCDDFDAAVPGDADGDGFACADDCDELDPLVHRGAAPICGNGHDDDCNGIADCGLHGLHDVDDVADVKLSGSFVGDRLGARLAVGEVTGDGQNDLIVHHNGKSTNHVRIFAGPLASQAVSDDSASLLWAADMTTFAVGDFDHDGSSDVILSAGGRGTAAQGHLWFGPVAPGEPQADALVLDYAYGIGNVSACDVSHDGGDDVVYAWWDPPGEGLDTPALQLVHGPITADLPKEAVAATVHDPEGSFGFGTTVRCADYDADGLQDLLVSSAPWALWLLGGSDIPQSTDVTIQAVGRELAGLHGDVSDPFDFDGDGYLDQGWSGAIFNGPLSGGGPIAVVDPPTSGTFRMTSQGDVDGDALPDLIVLDYSFYEPALGASSGGALRIHLSPIEGYLTLDDAEAIVADDLTSAEGVGPMLTFAPPSDLNQDGFLDLIVGAPDRDEAGEGAGRAFVLFGEPAGM